MTMMPPPSGGDDTAALIAALADAVSGPNGGVVQIPPLPYRILSPIKGTIPPNKSLTIQGSGQDVTTLFCPNNSGLTLEVGAVQTSSFHIRDLSLVAGAKGSGTALTLQNTTTLNVYPGLGPLNDISNVTIRGDLIDIGLNQNYFGTGIKAKNVSQINYTGLNYCGGRREAYVGLGVDISGTDNFFGNQMFSCVHVFDSCDFSCYGTGIRYGTLVQGVFVDKTNFNVGDIGILVPSGMVGVDQLSLTNSQFSTHRNSHVNISGLNCVMIANNLFIIGPKQYGVVHSGDSFTATGNVFAGTDQTKCEAGIVAFQSIQGVITGNSFSDLIVGVDLRANTKNVNVQSNTYRNVTTKVQNLGTGNSIGGGSV